MKILLLNENRLPFFSTVFCTCIWLYVSEEESQTHFRNRKTCVQQTTCFWRLPPHKEIEKELLKWNLLFFNKEKKQREKKSSSSKPHKFDNIAIFVYPVSTVSGTKQKKEIFGESNFYRKKTESSNSRPHAIENIHILQSAVLFEHLLDVFFARKFGSE